MTRQRASCCPPAQETPGIAEKCVVLPDDHARLRISMRGSVINAALGLGSAGGALSAGLGQAVYQCRGCVLRISVILCGDSDGVAQISQ